MKKVRSSRMKRSKKRKKTMRMRKIWIMTKSFLEIPQT